MKYHIQGNGVLEGTAQEVATVIRALRYGKVENEVKPRKKYVHGGHYKMQYRRPCPNCNKTVKGATGLAAHRRFCTVPSVTVPVIAA